MGKKNRRRQGTTPSERRAKREDAKTPFAKEVRRMGGPDEVRKNEEQLLQQWKDHIAYIKANGTEDAKKLLTDRKVRGLTYKGFGRPELMQRMDGTWSTWSKYNHVDDNATIVDDIEDRVFAEHEEELRQMYKDAMEAYIQHKEAEQRNNAKIERNDAKIERNDIEIERIKGEKAVIEQRMAELEQFGAQMLGRLGVNDEEKKAESVEGNAIEKDNNTLNNELKQQVAETNAAIDRSGSLAREMARSQAQIDQLDQLLDRISISRALDDPAVNGSEEDEDYEPTPNNRRFSLGQPIQKEFEVSGKKRVFGPMTAPAAGEEGDEDVLFRAVVECFDTDWFELGRVLVRILRQKKTSRIRLLVSDNQTEKVLMNHPVDPSSGSGISPHESGSNDSVYWIECSYPDGKTVVKEFVLQFESHVIADNFKEHFQISQNEMVAMFREDVNNELLNGNITAKDKALLEKGWRNDACSHCGKEATLYLCGGTCYGAKAYCGKRCQKSHWKSEHHGECKRIPKFR